MADSAPVCVPKAFGDRLRRMCALEIIYSSKSTRSDDFSKVVYLSAFIEPLLPQIFPSVSLYTPHQADARAVGYSVRGKYLDLVIRYAANELLDPTLAIVAREVLDDPIIVQEL